MELTPVNSSNIKAIGYEDGNLIVQYLSGTKYKYKNVSNQLFEDFKKADSKGHFMNEQVKNKFDYEKMA